jgi:hypothetical protein
MYNLRYHVASLVAVFLALALGLVLGGLVVDRGALDSQRKALTEGLRADLDELSSENRDLRDSLRLQTSLADEAADRAIAGELEGRSVLLVMNAGRADGVSDIRQAVERAGGKLAIATLEAPELGLSDAAVAAAVKEGLGLAGTPELSSIASSLAAEWAQPGERPVTTALIDAGVLSLEELADDEAASAVVVTAAFDDRADQTALAVAEEMSQAGARAVGAEMIGRSSGVAQAAVDSGIGAVDTIGSAAGRWSLVRLLTGAPPRFYGLGEGADALYPPLPEPGQ